MAKNSQKIKLEADVGGFKSNIKEAEKSITTLNKQLKLNQAQLEGNSKDTNVLSNRIEFLTSKYQEQGKKVENYKALIKTLNGEYEKQHQKTEELRAKYEETAQSMGKNSDEAKKLADELLIQENREKSLKNTIAETNNKLISEETALQKVKNELDKTTQELDKTTQELKEQKSWLLNTGKAWEESGKRLQKYGEKIDKLGNKLSVASGAVGGVAIGALKASVDFESAFTGVTKTVDGTEEQLSQLRKEILELSTQLPSSASEIAGVAETAGQLGIQTENIMKFTKVMIDLGNSTVVSADEAASSLAKFANVTKMSANDYDKLGSVIVDLGNNFATTEADIIAMGTRLAATGELTGLSQAQIMALATAMSSVGIEAEAGRNSNE